MKKLVILRRCTQALFLILFIYILWATTYPLKSSFSASSFFVTNPLIIIITSISERIILPGIFLCFLMLIASMLIGRFFCGWVCPLGTMIDIAGSISLKKGKKNKTSAGDSMRNIKYFILSGIILFALFGIQTAWVFDPIVLAARFVSLNLIPTITLIMDKSFIYLIKATDFYPPLYDFYGSLKNSILGVNIRYFDNSGIILTEFLVIMGIAFLKPRWWCRFICPLGAIYSLAGKVSPLKRVVEECINCKRCISKCRMNAINPDMSYDQKECILCMDCVYSCPGSSTKFMWHKGTSIKETKVNNTNEGISRKNFLLLIASSLFLMGAKIRSGKLKKTIIRPPGALKEKEFVDRCVRCGNCMKVCITNGLQPVMLENGLESIWTPQLVPEIGYCEYNCALCGNVCPTGAIPKLALDDKKKMKLGIASVDRSKCIAWKDNEECIVCEEHCPVSNKAIKLIKDNVGGKIIYKPFVDKELCIGCGICQNKCPVRPVRAITVDASLADRTGVKK